MANENAIHDENNQKVILLNRGDWEYSMARADKNTNTMMTIDYPHHEIHGWSTYHICNTNLAIPNNGTIDFVITVAWTKQAHTIFDGKNWWDANMELYESPTWVSWWTTLIPRNKNRDVWDWGNQVTALLNPTIWWTWTLLENFYIPWWSWFFSIGWSWWDRDEWVLSPWLVYLLRLTNVAWSTQPASLRAEWYEHTDKT